MKVLDKTKVYLVGHMEYGEGRSWRNDLTPFLKEMGVTVFDPYDKPFVHSIEEDEEARVELKQLMADGKLNEVSAHMKQVRSLDLSMVDRSDFIIAYINPAVPTFGTVEEIVTAVRMKRPCFIVIEGGVKKTPLWLLGMLPPKYFYNDFDELRNVLASISDGTKELDSDRWRLLKPEYR